ncbi:MAG: hypothetical protein IT428_16115 [Planctomycetaceae bacterium]|nr:hypothetical protein [Planctomycetaceae bacterium]
MADRPLVNTDPVDPALLAEGTMKIPEAAKFLGVDSDMIFRLLSEGLLPWTQLRPNGVRLIPKAALKRLLEQNMVNAESFTPAPVALPSH